MLKASRFALIAFALLLAVPAAAAHAAQRMPIGFFDDPSFRWSANRLVELQRAQATGSSVIHTTASWPALAPTTVAINIQDVHPNLVMIAPAPSSAAGPIRCVRPASS